MSFFDNVLKQVQHRKIPVTATIIGTTVTLFVLDFFFRGALKSVLAFYPALIASQPFGLITFPFVGNYLMSVIFLSFWMWWMGGVIENELSSRKFISFWLILTLLGAVAHLISYMLTGYSSGLSGLWLPVASITVAWGTRYPNSPITFMFILPLTGKWLALLAVALAFFGSGDPINGFFALLPMAFAFLYASNRIPFMEWGAAQSYKGKSQKEKEQEERQFRNYIDKVYDKQKEREERERLRKLFEKSFEDNDDK